MAPSLRLALAGALLLVLAFPRPALPFLAPAGVALLLAAFRGRSPRQAFLSGWAAGAVWSALSLRWLAETLDLYGGIPFPVAVFLILGMGAVMGLWTGLFGALAARLGPDPLRALLLLPPSGCFWRPPGSGSPSPSPGSSWGRPGRGSPPSGPFWRRAGSPCFHSSPPGRGWFSGSPARWCGRPGSGRRRPWRGGRPFSSSSPGGCRSPCFPRREGDPPHRGGGAGKLPPGPAVGSGAAGRHPPRLPRPHPGGRLAGARLVVWPESSLPFFLQADRARAEMVRETARGLGVHLVFGRRGSTSRALSGPSATAPSTFPPRGPSPATTRRGWSPSGSTSLPPPALLRGEGGSRGGVVPPRHLAGPLAPAGALRRAGVLRGGLRRHPPAGGEGRGAAPPQPHQRRVVRDLLGPYQHLAFASLRAAETGIPLVRAANTGISAIYDGEGREQGRLPLFTRGILTAEISVPGPSATLSTRWGEWVVALCAIWAIIFYFFSRPRLRMGRRGKGDRTR